MISFNTETMAMSYNDNWSLKNFSLSNEGNSATTVCPHCESADFIKYGSYKSTPRFKCKCCLRTFSSRTNTIWYYSKKKPEVWKEFCMLQMECKSLAFCAKHLNINIATAFYWRHKLLKILSTLTEAKALQNHVFMLHRFIMESFKGTKGAATYCRSRLWMLFTYDSCDNSVNLPYSRDSWRKEIFDKVIYSKVAPKTFISTHGNNYITALARKHNKRLKQPSDDIIHSGVQGIFKTYKAIIKSTHGIATKYLTQYLGLVKAICLNQTLNFNSIFYLNNSNTFIKSNKIKKLRTIELF